MMEYQTETSRLLAQLATLQAPNQALIVGTLGATSVWLEQLQQIKTLKLTVVEPQKSIVKKLSTNKAIKIYDETIGTGQKATYYTTSLNSENGLYHPDNLHNEWPNIDIISKAEVNTVSITDFCAKHQLKPQWLVIENLAATTILQSFSAALNSSVTTILARVKMPVSSNDTENDTATLSALKTFLAPYSFHLIANETTANPKLGYALFIKEEQTPAMLTFNQQLTEKTLNSVELSFLERSLNQLRESLFTNNKQQLENIQQWINEQNQAELTTNAIKKQTTVIGELSESLIKHEKQLKEIEKNQNETTIAAIKKQTNTINELAKLLKSQIEQNNKNNNDNAINELTKLLKQREQQLEKAEQNIELLKKEIKQINEEHHKEANGDANINDFINDLEPLFYGKALTYVDIGAFVGEVFVKLANSRKIKIREAHLFEPNPESYQKLQKNIEKISISSLHSYNVGIGESEKEQNFVSSRSMTKAVELPEGVEISDTFTTQCKPLSAFSDIFTEGYINLLKIDVEGFEMDVLRSAEFLFAKEQVDMLYIEAGMNKDGKQQTYFALIDQFMQQFGYRLFKIYEQKYEWISDLPILRRCNLAYISPEFAKHNPHSAVQEINQLRSELALLKKIKE